MSEQYVIALDEGTTSARAVLIDSKAQVVDIVQNPFEQIFPNPGWVEHNPREILSAQMGAFTTLMVQHNLQPEDINAIGITNQRETTVVWDRATGEPVYNAIVWQCRRTASVIDEICGDDPDIRARITAKTGLVADPYFSASKLKWILDNVEGARERAEAGELCFGTIDTWLIWELTGGKSFVTDVTNASRTMLYNIHDMCWDEELCELFGVPMSMLPEVLPSAAEFGVTKDGIRITGNAGDQQAALFGQGCFTPGTGKCTYGTGCFFLMHTGHDAPVSERGLVTTIAASAPGTEGTEYALEGSVFMGGALIQWLRDELKIIENAADTEEIAESVEDTQGVYIVPAFTGLGAPYWDAEARGAILGLTRGAGRAHIVRAALEALAYQVNDLSDAMIADAGMALSVLNVDGGAANNNFLMQFQADMMKTPINRPDNTETTALGAAFLAGLQTGFWSSVDEVMEVRTINRAYEPSMDDSKRDELLAGWKAAVARTMTR